MGGVDVDLVDIKGMKDPDLVQFLQKHAISLTPFEARRIVKLIGRNPTITELHIFNIQWSEHSSYKSSRAILKTLPTKAPNVILGPVEDSGIVELGIIKGEKYGIVASHESHNHPSQVVPYEGAATGVGGIMRDILCMGSEIIATADPLRFGDPKGKQKNKVKYIANEVINGIAGYGNAVGIPNIAGDIYMNKSFDDNCLVNVVCLGLIKQKDIIHSYAPKNSEGYDIILVGKPTDNSGFGGAAFASLILDDEAKDENKGAVQVPDPFLKNVLIRATYQVFQEAREKKVTLGFKDLGAGGVMCSTSELCADANFGAEINLDKVNTSIDTLPPFMILCSETQERFTWICPPSFTQTLLDIYNKDFALGDVAEHAAAVVIGKVTKNRDFAITHKGDVVCNAPIQAITSGIRYDRKAKKPKRSLKEPSIKEKKNYNNDLLKILALPHIANKARCYNHYDKNVLGNTVIESGQADAGLLRAHPSSYHGIALTVDNNPRYGRIDPYWGAAHAVAESMRNIAAIGARPAALTDCLNFGNPEKPEAFYDFKESVRGIKNTASQLTQYQKKNPVPIISGNVSFYNESKQGNAIDPSPIIACIGTMPDYQKSITMQLKKVDSELYFLGDRTNELGGSAFYEIHNELGKKLPRFSFIKEKNRIHTIISAIDQGLIRSCHDISDGGLAVAITEMCLGGNANGKIGAKLHFVTKQTSAALFSEAPGFVVEVDPDEAPKLIALCKKQRVQLVPVGVTTKQPRLSISNNGKNVIDLSLVALQKSWTAGFADTLR